MTHTHTQTENQNRRDLFAAAALTGLIASGDYSRRALSAAFGTQPGGGASAATTVVKEAFLIADEALAQSPTKDEPHYLRPIGQTPCAPNCPAPPLYDPKEPLQIDEAKFYEVSARGVVPDPKSNDDCGDPDPTPEMWQSPTFLACWQVVKELPPTLSKPKAARALYERVTCHYSGLLRAVRGLLAFDDTRELLDRDDAIGYNQALKEVRDALRDIGVSFPAPDPADPTTWAAPPVYGKIEEAGGQVADPPALSHSAENMLTHFDCADRIFKGVSPGTTDALKELGEAGLIRVRDDLPYRVFVLTDEGFNSLQRIKKSRDEGDGLTPEQSALIDAAAPLL